MKTSELFRNLNVLRLRGSGLTAKQISKEVGCSPGTVHNILDKYGDPKKHTSWKSAPPIEMVRMEFKVAADHLKKQAIGLRAEADRADNLAFDLEQV